MKPDDVERIIRKKHHEMTAVDRKNESKDQEKAAELAEMVSGTIAGQGQTPNAVGWYLTLVFAPFCVLSSASI